MSKRRTPIGVNGYYVEVDEDFGAAFVKRSTHRGLAESARFRFAEFGRERAEQAAVMTAYQLDGTAAAIAELTTTERAGVL